jgi:hypothetical protein
MAPDGAGVEIVAADGAAADTVGPVDRTRVEAM